MHLLTVLDRTLVKRGLDLSNRVAGLNSLSGGGRQFDTYFFDIPT